MERTLIAIHLKFIEEINKNVPEFQNMQKHAAITLTNEQILNAC
jgi:hypothetical protein